MGKMFERKIAGLALALGVRDTDQINQVYPFTDLALQLAQQASASKLSVFGHYPLDGLSVGSVMSDCIRPRLLARALWIAWKF
jgi:hypothetical protein